MLHQTIRKDDAWTLPMPDVRGWQVQDAAGRPMGRVEDVLADPDATRLIALVLTSGREIPANAFETGDHVVQLNDEVPAEGATPRSGAASTTREAPMGFERDFRDHFARNYAAGRYEDYAPAYAFGRQQAQEARFAGSTYGRAEEALRSLYEQHYGGSFDAVGGAVRYGFEAAQKAGATDTSEKATLYSRDDVQFRHGEDEMDAPQARETAKGMQVNPPHDEKSAAP